ncbi:MAG TPA: CvpA family protein [Burkholderiaceae bacterium]
MTLFDYIVVFILVCSVVIGVMRGLVREVLSLASWIVAFVVANAYGEVFARFLPNVIPGATLRLIVGFVVLFIGTRLLMGLLSLAVRSVVEAAGLSLTDRILGALFGFLRGALFVLALFMLGAMTTMPQQPFWKHALLRAPVQTAAHALHPLLPAELARRIRF